VGLGILPRWVQERCKVNLGAYLGPEMHVEFGRRLGEAKKGTRIWLSLEKVPKSRAIGSPVSGSAAEARPWGQSRPRGETSARQMAAAL
jgi:hypothetical protein